MEENTMKKRFNEQEIRRKLRAKMRWLATLDYILRKAGRVAVYIFYVAIGIALVVGFLVLYDKYFPYDKTQFPWTLVTALIAGPLTLYLWYWKHINERRAIEEQSFDTAIGYLTNHVSLQARVAAIYALENIANNNPYRAPNVVEILCSYLRINTTIIDSMNSKEKEFENKICLDMISRIWSRYHKYWNYKHNAQPDLRKLNMPQYDLWRVDLKKFYLEDSNFEMANLKSAMFDGSHISFAKFKKANLNLATFKKACVGGADFREVVNLSQVEIKKANGCKLTKLPSYLDMPKEWLIEEERIKDCHLLHKCPEPCKLSFHDI